VEAEAAAIVALAAEVVVDGNGAFDGLGLRKREAAVQEVGGEGDGKGKEEWDTDKRHCASAGKKVRRE
jgi:hypothetical protein